MKFELKRRSADMPKKKRRRSKGQGHGQDAGDGANAPAQYDDMVPFLVEINPGELPRSNGLFNRIVLPSTFIRLRSI